MSERYASDEPATSHWSLAAQGQCIPEPGIRLVELTAIVETEADGPAGVGTPG